MGDPGVPLTWWLGFLRAVAGVQAGDVAPARCYLQFVEAHRSRECAESVRGRIRRAQVDPGYFNAARMAEDVAAGRAAGKYAPVVPVSVKRRW